MQGHCESISNWLLQQEEAVEGFTAAFDLNQASILELKVFAGADRPQLPVNRVQTV